MRRRHAFWVGRRSTTDLPERLRDIAQARCISLMSGLNTWAGSGKLRRGGREHIQHLRPPTLETMSKRVVTHKNTTVLAVTNYLHYTTMGSIAMECRFYSLCVQFDQASISISGLRLNRRTSESHHVCSYMSCHIGIIHLFTLTKRHVSASPRVNRPNW